MLLCHLQMNEAESSGPSLGLVKASEYHLSWNNYEASLASFLRILSSAKDGEEALSDVTISCSGGKLFQAHRLVLATCSSYFRQLFVGRAAAVAGVGCVGHPIVYIPDMNDTVMEHLLAFMYRGETTVPTHALLPLIEAAKLLGIQGLMDPGNIKQLLEQNEFVESNELKDDKVVVNVPEVKVKADENHVNGVQDDKSDTAGEIIKEEVKDFMQTEDQKPDSSNNVVFPRISTSSQMTGPVFPTLTPLHNPLALSLATSQLALGLDISQHLGFSQGRRRKSSPTRSNNKSPRLTSPNASGASSSQINSSSGNGNVYAHYPPTEDPSRPFGCSQCPKRFRMKHHLKEHTLIHSGEMPFSCHLCPKRFNRSYTLKNHMKLHSAGSLPDKFQQVDTTDNHQFKEESNFSNMVVPLLNKPPSFH